MEPHPRKQACFIAIGVNSTSAATLWTPAHHTASFPAFMATQHIGHQDSYLDVRAQAMHVSERAPPASAAPKRNLRAMRALSSVTAACTAATTPQMMASTGSHVFAPTQAITRLDGTAREAYPANSIPAQGVSVWCSDLFMHCSSGPAQFLLQYWACFFSLSSENHLT